MWAGGAKIAEYEAFEAKVRAKAAEVGGDCDCVIVRAGTLKGGGPGDSTTTEGAPAAQTLTKAFYDQYSRDIVNWPLLFDAATLGVSLTPGDTAEGPGFQAAFTATSDGACKGDSSRVNVASALVRALGRDGVAWQDFGVTTAAGRNSPTDAEWDAEFAVRPAHKETPREGRDAPPHEAAPPRGRAARAITRASIFGRRGDRGPLRGGFARCGKGKGRAGRAFAAPRQSYSSAAMLRMSAVQPVNGCERMPRPVRSSYCS